VHNLYACFREVREIRQAIKDGRLMELLELRARNHPNLYQGFRELMMDEEALRLMEAHTPLAGRRGINLYDGLSLRRPRVRRARRRLLENYYSRKGAESMILIPATRHMRLEKLKKITGEEAFDAALYGTPYGLIPHELRYVYPFSQTNYPKNLIEENLEELLNLSLKQLSGRGPRKVMVLEAKPLHLRRFAERLIEALKARGLEVSLLRESRGRQPLSRPSKGGEDE